MDFRILVLMLIIMMSFAVLWVESTVTTHKSGQALQLYSDENKLFLTINSDYAMRSEKGGDSFPFLFFSQLNINKATENELLAISGLGPKSVHKIMKYRNEKGEITSNEDLLTIPGFGQGTIRKISPYIKYQ